MVDFLPFSTRKTTFAISCMLSCTSCPFRRVVYFKSTEFAAKGSKFFTFRADPFSKGS